MQGPDRRPECSTSLEALSAEKWAKLFRSFLSAPASSILPSRGAEELHDVLIATYENLSEKTACDAFGEGLVFALVSTPKDLRHADDLYYLLQTIARVTPVSGRILLRQELQGGAYSELRFAHQSLQALLLSVNSYYGVDEPLALYARRAAVETYEFGYLLVCFRVLSVFDPASALGLFPKIAPFLTSDEHLAQFATQVRAMELRGGAKQLYEWIRDNDPKLSIGLPDVWNRFTRELREGLEWPAVSSAVGDPYAALLAARLSAGTNLFDATDIVALARVALNIDRTDALEFFRFLWTEISIRDQNLEPWTYEDFPHVDTERRAEVLAGGKHVDLLWDTDRDLMGLLSEVTPSYSRSDSGRR